MNRNCLVLLVPLLLGGCLAQSSIQAEYMSQESECHSVAEDKVDDSANAATDRALVAGTAFSECMNGKGWKVAKPKAKDPKEPTTVAGGTPPVGPSTSGGIPGGTASGAAALKAPPKPLPGNAVPNATTPAAPVLGPGVQPDPAPAAEAVTQQPAAPSFSPPTPRVPNDPAASTYQPNGYAPQPAGGSAGRNF